MWTLVTLTSTVDIAPPMLKQCDVDTQAGPVIAPTITAEVHLNIGGRISTLPYPLPRQ